MHKKILMHLLAIEAGPTRLGSGGGAKIMQVKCLSMIQGSAPNTLAYQTNHEMLTSNSDFNWTETLQVKVMMTLTRVRLLFNALCSHNFNGVVEQIIRGAPCSNLLRSITDTDTFNSFPTIYKYNQNASGEILPSFT